MMHHDRKKGGRHGIFLSWLQLAGLLVILIGALMVWNTYLMHGELNVGKFYIPFLYRGYLLISSGVFVVIIGEFRKSF